MSSYMDEYRAAFAPDVPETPEWSPPLTETVIVRDRTCARDGIMSATVERRTGPWGRDIAVTVQNARVDPLTVWVTPLQAEMLAEGLLALAGADQ